MKRILLVAILLIAWCAVAHANYYAIKRSTEWVSIPLNKPIDSTYGIERKPDSVHVLVFTGSQNAPLYSARSTTYPFISTTFLDTSTIFTDTMYSLRDSVGHLNAGATSRTISVRVALYAGKYPTYTYGTIQIIGDTLQNYLARTGGVDSATVFKAVYQLLRDSCTTQDTAAIVFLDSLIARDQAGKLFKDSTFTSGLLAWIKNHGGVATLSNAQMGAIADSVYKKAWSAYTTYGTFGDLFRTGSDTSQYATSGDVAGATWNLTTTGNTPAGSFGYAVANAGGLTLQQLSAWGDSSDIVKYTNPTKQFILGGFHVEGTSTDTFPGAYSVRHHSTQNKPAIFAQGGGGGTSGHGMQILGGTSGGSGVEYTSQAGNSFGFKATGFGSGSGGYSVGGATGNGWIFGGGSSSGDGILAVSGHGAAFHSYGFQDFVVGVSGGGTISGNMALVDSVRALGTGGGGSGLTSAEKDTIFAPYRTAGFAGHFQVGTMQLGKFAVGGANGSGGSFIVSNTSGPGAVFSGSTATNPIVGYMAAAGGGASISGVTNLGTVNSNLVAVAGDAGTATNLMNIYDGSDLTRGSASYSKMSIVGANGSNGSLYVLNSNGPGANYETQSSLSSGLIAHGPVFGASFYPNITGDVIGTVDSVRSLNAAQAGLGVTDVPAIQTMMENLAATRPDLFYGPTNAGTGPYTILVTVVDSTARPSDTTLQGIAMAIFDSSGQVGGAMSSASGRIAFTQQAGRFVLKSTSLTYQFDSVVVVVTGNTTATVKGYPRNIPTRSAIVTVGVKTSDNAPAQGVWVSAYPEKSNAVDSSGAAIISTSQSAQTDSLGQVHFTCMWSSYMIPSTKWVVKIESPSGRRPWVDTIPRVSEYTINLR